MKLLEEKCKEIERENEELRAENSRLEGEMVSQQASMHQIQEIIQFINEEKDARESLQELASRLTGDLESIRQQTMHNQSSKGGKKSKNDKKKSKNDKK